MNLATPNKSVLFGLILFLISMAATAQDPNQECDVIDFDELTQGDYIETLSLFGGTVSLSVSTYRNWPAGDVIARAYDTEMYDLDAASPLPPPPNSTHYDSQRFIWCNPAANGGNGECEGIVANIPDENFDEYGDATNGGTITISGFTGDWEIPSYLAVDSDNRFRDIILTVGAGNTEVGRSSGLGDATVEKVLTSDHSFTGEAKFEFLGSGGIDEIEMCRTVQREPASLGDRVWEDRNVNGIQDCTDDNGDGIIGGPGDSGDECDAGIPDIEVNLLTPGTDGVCNTNDDVSTGMQDYTDEFGFYLFDNLEPGEYCVHVVKPGAEFCDTSGYELGTPLFTLLNQGNDDAVDSDVDRDTGVTGNIPLVSGQIDLTNDAGIYCPAKLGNYVWLDTDKDGIQGGGEAGVEGVDVELWECGPDGQPGTIDDVNTDEIRTTDASGMYMFGAEPGVYDLEPGNYFTVFKKPGGTVFTLPNQGGDDSLDSDCRAPRGETACTGGLDSREINLDLDCGLVEPNCDLQVNKTCLIPTPPPQVPEGKCDGKLAEFSIIWNGDGAIKVSGPMNDALNGDVVKGQRVTFYGPFSNNDVFVDISGSVSGQSVFHVSCSDPQFSTPEHCGLPAGNGKSDGAQFINDWLLDGWVDNSDAVLMCSGQTGGTPEFPTEENCAIVSDSDSIDVIYGYRVVNNGDTVTNITLEDDKLGVIASGFDLLNGESAQYTQPTTISGTVTNIATATGVTASAASCSASDSTIVMVEKPEIPPGSCADGKPNRLVFEYTGNDCSANNNPQEGKFVCDGDPNGAEPISIVMTKDADKIDVSPTSETIGLGQEFELKTKSGGRFGAETKFDIRQNGKTLQSLNIHTSCSKDLFVNDEFGGVILKEFYPSEDDGKKKKKDK